MEIYAPVRVEEGRIVPAVTEPQIVWVLGGSAWIEEREIGGRWLRTEVKKDYLFLTAPGPPYEMQWKATGRQPFASRGIGAEMAKTALNAGHRVDDSPPYVWSDERADESKVRFENCR